jgi:hypothetical protein
MDSQDREHFSCYNPNTNIGFKLYPPLTGRNLWRGVWNDGTAMREYTIRSVVIRTAPPKQAPTDKHMSAMTMELYNKLKRDQDNYTPYKKYTPASDSSHVERMSIHVMHERECKIYAFVGEGL